MMPEFTLEPLTEYPQREKVMSLARQHAEEVDQDSYSPYETLRAIAEDGLVTLGRDGSILQQTAVAFDLATECTSTAFSLWAHRSTIAFFDAVGKELPQGLVTAETTGTTAMAAAFKDASGVGEIQVHATHVDGGLELNGVISWASNLYPGGVVVLPVIVDDAEPGQPSKYIVHTTVDAAGFNVKYQKGLLALDATESGFIKLENVFVPEENLMSTDVPGFLKKITAPFLLLQSSFCLGLGAASLQSVSEHLDVAQGIFQEEFAQINSEYQRLRTELTELAENPASAERRRLLQLRLDAAHFATSATRIELAAIGGKAYKARCASARRLRESQFLPVQSPTEGHLRYELSKAQ